MSVEFGRQTTGFQYNSSRPKSEDRLSFGQGRLSDYSVSPKPKQGEPIHQVVRTEIRPDCVEKYIQLMKEDINGTRDEPGCLRFDMLKEKGTENKFIVYETYANEDALRYHLNTPHFLAVKKFLHNGGGAMEIEVTGATSVDFGLGF